MGCPWYIRKAIHRGFHVTSRLLKLGAWTRENCLSASHICRLARWTVPILCGFLPFVTVWLMIGKLWNNALRWWYWVDWSALTLPKPKGRGFLLPVTISWLTSPFLVGRSTRYGCAITHHRAEHIAPYADMLLPHISVLLDDEYFTHLSFFRYNHIDSICKERTCLYSADHYAFNVLKTCSCL